MKTRFSVATDTPKLFEALVGLNEAITAFGTDQRLTHLVKIRVSQINGCAFCVGKHTKEALDDGVEQQVLNMLTVWHDTRTIQ